MAKLQEVFGKASTAMYQNADTAQQAGEQSTGAANDDGTATDVEYEEVK